MKSVGGQLYRTINGMVKGEQPYEQAKVDAAFAAIEATLPKAKPLYDTKSEQAAANSNYRPTAKIWETKADFDGHFDKVQKAVAEQKAKVKNLDDLKAGFTAVNQACTACHEGYRVKN
jgi:cytochrome c556